MILEAKGYRHPVFSPVSIVRLLFVFRFCHHFPFSTFANLHFACYWICMTYKKQTWQLHKIKSKSNNSSNNVSTFVPRIHLISAVYFNFNRLLLFIWRDFRAPSTNLHMPQKCWWKRAKYGQWKRWIDTWVYRTGPGNYGNAIWSKRHLNGHRIKAARNWI